MRQPSRGVWGCRLVAREGVQRRLHIRLLPDKLQQTVCCVSCLTAHSLLLLSLSPRHFTHAPVVFSLPSSYSSFISPRSHLYHLPHAAGISPCDSRLFFSSVLSALVQSLDWHAPFVFLLCPRSATRSTPVAFTRRHDRSRSTLAHRLETIVESLTVVSGPSPRFVTSASFQPWLHQLQASTSPRWAPRSSRRSSTLRNRLRS